MPFRVLLALFVAAFLLPASAKADPVPADATWTQVWFPSQDGTMLRADVFLPANRAPSDRHPVILSIGPYFGSSPTGVPIHQGPVLRFNDLITEGRIFGRGYAYVQVDSRGYGGSGGCSDLGGPGEQSDAEAAVNWAARQPWSNGKVGMWGKSYDAWTQVMALRENPAGLAAAVIQSPIIDGYRIAFMNGVHYSAGWYGTPGLYAGYDLAPPSVLDSPPEEFLYPAAGTAAGPACYAENLAMTPLPQRSLPYWQQRELSDVAAMSTVPVLWSHGFNDANTKPDNFLPVWSRLRGPKRAWFGQYDHVRGNQSGLVGRGGFMQEAMDWLDRYLKGAPAVDYPAVEIQDGEGRWRAEDSWPPADGVLYTMPVRPASYIDTPLLTGTDLWTVTPPAPYDLRFAGEPVLDVDVTFAVPGANLIPKLYDVAPDGIARLVTRGATLLPGPGRLSFALYPQDWVLRAGHRLGVKLDRSDPHFQPTYTTTPVDIAGGTLSLPFLRFERTPDLAGGPAQAMQRVPRELLVPATIAGATVDWSFPPPMEPRP